jgi:HlyD family secretion protein
MKKKFLLISLLATSPLLLFYFFFNKNDKAQVIFEVQKPTYRNIQQFISTTGTIQAKDHVIIGSLVEGKVIKIHAENNDSVKKGQVLVELDNGIGYSNVQKAQAALKETQAKKEFQKKYSNRQKELYLQGQISQNSFDEVTKEYLISKAKVLDAQATLEKEKSLFNNLKITSPVDGIIISKKVSIGQMVTSRLDATAIFEIALDLKKMEIYLDVDEADIGLVAQQQKVFCKVDAFPNNILELSVHRIEHQVKKIDYVVSYSVILNLENNKLLFRPGMTVNAEIEVANTKNSLTIPNKSFRINSLQLKKHAKDLGYSAQEAQNQSGIFGKQDSIWIKQNNALIETSVIIGAYDKKYSEIKQGISFDDDIVANFIQEKDSSNFLKKFFGAKVGG